jgi:heme a synthase
MGVFRAGASPGGRADVVQCRMVERLDASAVGRPSPPAGDAAGGGASPAFVRFAWGVLVYLVFVILFGAWVRITGSGAGCGSHWPTCHGEVIPPSPSTETLIEYTHRLTSGLLGIVVVVLVVWAFRAFPGLHRVRIAALVTLAFTLLEAAIGAGLVLAELVGSDDSIARAVVVGVHLAATFSLTAATALTAHFASGAPGPRWSALVPRARRLLVLAAFAIIVVSMTGAVTALGDTLFPVSPTVEQGLFARLRDDLSASQHFLVRLRIVHPLLAAVVALCLIALPNWLSECGLTAEAERFLELLRASVVIQVLIGMANIYWGAPGWIQIVHLAVSQLVWVSMVLAMAAAFGPRSPARTG